MIRLLILWFSCSSTLVAQTPDENPTDIETGNGFVRVCSSVEKIGAGNITDKDLASIGLCTGYLMGLGDGLELANAATANCALVLSVLPDPVPRYPGTILQRLIYQLPC